MPRCVDAVLVLDVAVVTDTLKADLEDSSPAEACCPGQAGVVKSTCA